MKLVLVTGASGFVGRNITRALLKAGYRVRAQYRRENPPEELVEAAGDGAELMRGDLVEEMAGGGAEGLLEGVDVIVHTAANVSQTGPRRAFELINVDVTRWLLESAAVLGCGRFIYLSSVAVQGFGEHKFSSEDGPYFGLISNYQKSKREAENIVSAFDQKNMPATILRLGFVYGPGDKKILHTVFDLLDAGKLPLINGFDVYNCLLYVDDLVHAVILAIESPLAANQIFNIAGNDLVTLRDALNEAARLLRKPAPRIDIPVRVARIAGFLMEKVFTLFRLSGEPNISPYLVEQLSSNYHFTSDKAKELIGYAPKVGWQTGLKKVIEAYRAEN